jgi:hypothetical protein
MGYHFNDDDFANDGDVDPFHFPHSNDLPDMETLVWKLIRQGLNEDTNPLLTEEEKEYLAHAAKAVCPECGGMGESGRDHLGMPLECKTCRGRR